jgi:hypothetical protein
VVSVSSPLDKSVIVSLSHPNHKREAEEARANIDRIACGGFCKRLHEVISTSASPLEIPEVELPPKPWQREGPL